MAVGTRAQSASKLVQNQQKSKKNAKNTKDNQKNIGGKSEMENGGNEEDPDIAKFIEDEILSLEASLMEYVSNRWCGGTFRIG